MVVLVQGATTLDLALQIIELLSSLGLIVGLPFMTIGLSK